MVKACMYEGCFRPRHGRGYCTKHYQRLRKFGDPSKVLYRLRHGDPKHPLYNVYTNMLARCYNSNNKRYKNYAGRGITVCDRWLNDFRDFANDVGKRPVGTSLDRKDNNKGYSPDNCRWATKYEQAGNMTTNGFSPGVSWHSLRQKWRARVKVNGKEVHLGLFTDIDLAKKTVAEYRQGL